MIFGRVKFACCSFKVWKTVFSLRRQDPPDNFCIKLLKRFVTDEAAKELQTYLMVFGFLASGYDFDTRAAIFNISRVRTA